MLGDQAIQGDEVEDHEATKEECNDEVSIEESPVPLWRSSRVSHLPKYLEDYELLCEEDEYETLCDIECEHLLLLVNDKHES